jgi:hypothetical protein
MPYGLTQRNAPRARPLGVAFGAFSLLGRPNDRPSRPSTGPSPSGPSRDHPRDHLNEYQNGYQNDCPSNRPLGPSERLSEGPLRKRRIEAAVDGAFR